jgi:hypothetical protein
MIDVILIITLSAALIGIVAGIIAVIDFILNQRRKKALVDEEEDTSPHGAFEKISTEGQKTLEESRQYFTFIDFSIRLVTKQRNPETHHVLSRTIRNNSTRIIDRHFNFIFGDNYRSYKKINLCATNREGAPLPIENKEDFGRKKEFFVHLIPPLPPSGTTTYVIEYDWAEPKQTYEIEVISSVERFEFVILAQFPLHVDYLLIYEEKKYIQVQERSSIQPTPITEGDLNGWKWVASDMKEVFLAFKWRITKF